MRNGCAFPLNSRFHLGCALSFRHQYNFDFKMVGDPVEILGRIFDDNGAAQKQEPTNGKAQPFLTSGGEADANNNVSLVVA